MPDATAAIARIKNERSIVKAPVVGYNFKTSFSPQKNGHWSKHVDGTDTWSLKIHSTGALGMAVVLANVSLNQAERLFVYNLNGVGGIFTSNNVPASGILPLGYLKGDEIVIEYNVPENKSPGTFIVESVSHAFRDSFFGGSADGCNTGIRCPEGLYWDTARRSVVRLIIHNDEGSKMCTGSLVNNTTGDKKPYILTAEHCVSDQNGADRTIITFNYENTDCNSDEASQGIDLYGAFLRASLYENDFALLEAHQMPPLATHPYYAGWDVSDEHRHHVACIHHPWGNTKKISLFNGSITTSSFEDDTHAKNAFWNVRKWDVGVTEAGSSGAPLFNNNHRLIGSLTGGSSACGSPYNDYFQKLSSSWEAHTAGDKQLRRWLDPLSTGVSSLDGLDPFEGVTPVCDTLTNILPDESLALMHYVPSDPQSGYISGVNSDNIAMYAEKFFSADSIMITGVKFETGSLNSDAEGGVVVAVHIDEGGVPGETIFETYVPYSDLGAFTDHISFYPYVNVRGGFFISYTVSYSENDTFALQHVTPHADRDNTAFMKFPQGWVAMNDVISGGYSTSLGMRVLACRNVPLQPDTSEKLVFFPNPAATVVVARIPEGATGELHFGIYDLQGKQHFAYRQINGNNLVLDVTELRPGMYIVRMSASGKVYLAKFIRQR